MKLHFVHAPRRAFVALCASSMLAACHLSAISGSSHESGEWTPGTASHEVSVGSNTRNFILHVPIHAPRTRLGLTAPFPLIIALHGSSGSPEDVRHASRLDSVADSRGFLVAYPNGSKGRFGLYHSDWNAGACCGQAQRENVDDVAFIRAVIDRVAAQLPVDGRRVYVAGFSDGGRMAYRVACAAADRIAAVGVVSGSLVDTGCAPTAPMSVIAFHGTADSEVAYNDPALTPPVRPVPAAAAALPPAIRFWAAHNGCRGAVARQPSRHVTQTALSSCAGADVVLYTIDGGVHGWPGEPADGAGSEAPMSELDATDVMVRFLLRHGRR